MTACVEDAAVLVNAFHIDAQLFFQDVDLVVYGQDGGCYRRAALFARLLGVRVKILINFQKSPAIFISTLNRPKNLFRRKKCLFGKS